jgi:hypothetical protein
LALENRHQDESHYTGGTEANREPAEKPERLFWEDAEIEKEDGDLHQTNGQEVQSFTYIDC